MAEPATGQAADPPNDPLAGVPELGSYSTSDPAEITAALKLVADSVAQQRQIASRALIFNPLNIVVYTVVLAIMAQYMYHGSRSDWTLIFTTGAGITMAFLVAVRGATGGYLELAEKVGINLIEGADVLVTKFGEEIIGTVILAKAPVESSGKRRKGYKGEIRGWAVRIRYRGKGVGTDLLADAVEELKNKGVESIEFSDDTPSELFRSHFKHETRTC